MPNLLFMNAKQVLSKVFEGPKYFKSNFDRYIMGNLFFGVHLGVDIAAMALYGFDPKIIIYESPVLATLYVGDRIKNRALNYVMPKVVNSLNGIFPHNQI